MFERVTVILKPTNACNIRCKYCYHEEAGYENHKLALENCERLLRALAENTNEALITWHGGEPMLMGIPYFESVIELERKIEAEHPGRLKFLNCIQTNGTLINKDWIKLFKKHDFQIGISFDGPSNEITRDKTERVLEGIELLQREGVHVSCLSVIARPNIDQVEVYEFFKKKRINCVFNPILGAGAGEGNTELLISAEEYIDSSKKLFDRWIYDTEGVDVFRFETYLSSILGVKKMICENAACIGKWICMEPDGTLQLCSHFVGNEYSFGNIKDYNTLEEIFSSDNVAKLLRLSIGKRDICKESGCAFYKYCHGGCIYSNIHTGVLDRTGGFECQSFRAIFGYVQAFVKRALEENIDINTLNPYARACFIKYISRINEPT